MLSEGVVTLIGPLWNRKEPPLLEQWKKKELDFPYSPVRVLKGPGTPEFWAALNWLISVSLDHG
jgi:hypothetical protein